MNENNDILDRINHRHGMTVPEGYFDDFAKRMAESLPKQDWESAPKVMPRSFWQKVRPYVYMAAMFAGVWCMMKMFDLMRPDIGIDTNPVLVSAVSNDDFVRDYYSDCYPGEDIYDDLFDEGYVPEPIDFASDDNE